MEPEIVEIQHTVVAVPPERCTPEGLAAFGVVGFQVGCREFLHRGWLNSDLARLEGPDGSSTHTGGLFEIDGALYFEHDATKPFPLPEGIFRVIASEHFIEHVPPQDAIAWLTEMHRILAPGGLLRVSTPDLAIYCSGYLDPEKKFFREHAEILKDAIVEEVPDSPAWMVNQIFYGYGHRYIYDYAELVRSSPPRASIPLAPVAPPSARAPSPRSPRSISRRAATRASTPRSRRRTEGRGAALLKTGSTGVGARILHPRRALGR
ncbi:MAG: methyltransferase domain-containing protein [Planctomycetota bacterium]